MNKKNVGLKVKYAEKVIEMTAKFAKDASRFNSGEYMLLKEARHDFPEFDLKIVNVKHRSSRDCMKGLTYEYMEQYIQSHDNEEKSIMAEYRDLRGLSEEAKAVLAGSASYIKVKQWFLKKFPEIMEFRQNRNNALAC